jgi:hypothetical protein
VSRRNATARKRLISGCDWCHSSAGANSRRRRVSSGSPRRRGQRPLHLLHEHRRDARQHRHFAREVGEEGPLADVGALGDFRHRRLVEAARREQLERSFLDAQPRLTHTPLDAGFVVDWFDHGCALERGHK